MRLIYFFIFLKNCYELLIAIYINSGTNYFALLQKTDEETDLFNLSFVLKI